MGGGGGFCPPSGFLEFPLILKQKETIRTKYQQYELSSVGGKYLVSSVGKIYSLHAGWKGWTE